MVDSYIHLHSRRAWEPGCRISLVLWLVHLRVYAISSFPFLSCLVRHDTRIPLLVIISSNLCANTNRYCSLPFMTAAVLVLYWSSLIPSLPSVFITYSVNAIAEPGNEAGSDPLYNIPRAHKNRRLE